VEQFFWRSACLWTFAPWQQHTRPCAEQVPLWTCALPVAQVPRRGPWLSAPMLPSRRGAARFLPGCQPASLPACLHDRLATYPEGIDCEGPYTGNILIFLSIINIYIILYKKIYKGFAWIYIISCISKQIPLNIICSLRVFHRGIPSG